ncbi:hypothetical protein [Thermotoga profunda]|uniref:hypothetical protein n=1 Tax=Thermotoga profunda TaxID=1508420 RepID=UPI000596CE60|nr:hypothetical protein [Thermotoga profunda]
MHERPRSENIDQICAKYSIGIISEMTSEYDPKEVQNLITKALGVLQQQGLYSFGLFCKAESKAGKILENIIKMLHEIEVLDNSTENELSKLSKLSENIHDLILAVEIVEKTLIYSRYHAKALVKETSTQSE